MSRGTAMSTSTSGRFRRAGKIASTSARLKTMSGLPVELTRMSASVIAAAESSMRTARPPNSAASFSARSNERLATSTVFAPRLARCLTQASPILPAPKIITVFSLKSRSKTFSASSTATLPTEVAPRPMAVWCGFVSPPTRRSGTAGSSSCRSSPRPWPPDRRS